MEVAKPDEPATTSGEPQEALAEPDGETTVSALADALEGLADAPGGATLSADADYECVPFTPEFERPKLPKWDF